MFDSGIPQRLQGTSRFHVPQACRQPTGVEEPWRGTSSMVMITCFPRSGAAQESQGSILIHHIHQPHAGCCERAWRRADGDGQMPGDGQRLRTSIF